MKDPLYIAGEEVFGKVKPYRYNPPTLSESFEGQRMNLVLLAAWCALMAAFAFAAVRRLRAQYGKKIMLKIIFSHEVRQLLKSTHPLFMLVLLAAAMVFGIYNGKRGVASQKESARSEAADEEAANTRALDQVG